MEEPGLRYLHRAGVEGLCDVVELFGLQRCEAAQGEEGNVGDALFGEVVDEGVVVAVDYVVEVLDADDPGDFLCFGELGG